MNMCWRSECQTTGGCAHRGPNGELCWFFVPTEADRLRTETEALRKRVAELEAAMTEMNRMLVATQDDAEQAEAQLAEAKAALEQIAHGIEGQTPSIGIARAALAQISQAGEG